MSASQIIACLCLSLLSAKTDARAFQHPQDLGIAVFGFWVAVLCNVLLF